MHHKRCKFEANAIRLLQSILGKDSTPEIIHESNNILILEFINTEFQFEGEQNYEQLTQEHFKKIGEMLGKLHKETENKTDALKNNPKDFTDYDLLRTDTAEKLFPEEVKQFKEDLKTSTQSVIWADCCPKNILINNDRICFIDLEFTHYAEPALDIGFFLAHILLYALRFPEHKDNMDKGIKLFLDSYKEQNSDDKTIKLSMIYAGIIMLHKTQSIGKYDKYSEIIEDAQEFAKKLITE